MVLLKKIIYFGFIFLFGLKAFSQTDNLVNNCNSNSIDELYSLIYSPLEPFEPPASAIDDDGNITASEDELFSLRRRHFYDQLKGQKTLSINLQTYATINRQLPGVLEDFEPVIKILLPDCQPVSLFRGVPVSNTKADFNTILKTIEIGLKSEIEAIVNYARSYVEPNPIKFEEILGILKNDLAITPEIINAILPEPIADRYFPDGNIPTGNLSEAAILAFVSLGGTVINPPNQIFFIKPRSYSGVIEDYSSLIIQEDGTMLRKDQVYRKNLGSPEVRGSMVAPVDETAQDIVDEDFMRFLSYNCIEKEQLVKIRECCKGARHHTYLADMISFLYQLRTTPNEFSETYQPEFRTVDTVKLPNSEFFQLYFNSLRSFSNIFFIQI